MRRFRAVLLALGAAVVLAAATAAAAWWQIGDQSTVPLAEAPDYAMPPPAIGPVAERLLGLGGVAVAALLTGGLAWRTGRRRLSPAWWLVALPAVAAGYLVALIGRTLTAGVIGANIGAGLALLVFGPLVAVLALWILGWAIGIPLSRRPVAGQPA